MKKLLLIAMVILTLPIFAQDYTMRISNFMAADSWEAYDYIYGSPTGTDLQCINKHDFITPMEYIDSLTLDENGNITRLATWQIFEGEWFFACYCDYTYNEMGLRETRKNYNNFDNHFELGGTYTYNYDENGKMTDWKCDFVGVEYEKATIEYNENGLIQSETVMQYNFATYYMEYSYMTEYEYDENGNITRIMEYNYDTETWVPQIYRIYEYDEFNNCIEQRTTTPAGTVQEKYVYVYDTEISAENIYHFANPEDDFPKLPQMKNLLRSFEFHTLNDSNELVYVTDYLFNYEVIADVQGVKEVAVSSNIYPNPAQDYIMIESSEVEYVEIIDIYGRVLYATEMRESVKVDMSEFESGVYFVRTKSNVATSVEKIVKK